MKMSAVIGYNNVTDLDLPVNNMESATPVPSDSSNYGSSSLEFIIPERQQLHMQNAEFCPESNIDEADFKASATYTKLNIVSPNSFFCSAGTQAYYRAIGCPEASLLNCIQTWNFHLSPAASLQLAQIIETRVNNFTQVTINLFLIRNTYNSIWFGILLYGLTYIGARFNFLTLCIGITVLSFGVPKLLDLCKAQIEVVTRQLFGKFKTL
ncbi:unnamed protein product [Hymenolepis diminuta]|uniref:Reticulon-like protein n=1 Tax=Hymenolepis diminuta TaxID=6216 RepID=A0A564XWH6_HYMDI|nr:unnamed protein product [Hymenolepis diminuta]